MRTSTCRLLSCVEKLIRLEPLSKHILRVAISIVLIWIGGLKYVPYEAEGIVPFVANSPFMFFFYNHPEQYKDYKHKEGAVVIKDYEWHVSNNTYGYSYGLGTLLVIMGVLLLLHYVHPIFGLIGGVLVFIMAIGTLSFLVTTPECWVNPFLGGSVEKPGGFPNLSGAGRLVIKDVIMFGGAWVVGIDSAKQLLARCKCAQTDETKPTQSC